MNINPSNIKQNFSNPYGDAPGRKEKRAAFFSFVNSGGVDRGAQLDVMTDAIYQTQGMVRKIRDATTRFSGQPTGSPTSSFNPSGAGMIDVTSTYRPLLPNPGGVSPTSIFNPNNSGGGGGVPPTFRPSPIPAPGGGGSGGGAGLPNNFWSGSGGFASTTMLAMKQMMPYMAATAVLGGAASFVGGTMQHGKSMDFWSGNLATVGSSYPVGMRGVAGRIGVESGMGQLQVMQTMQGLMTAGIPESSAIGALGTTTKMARAGLMSGREAASLMGMAGNVYGIDKAIADGSFYQRVGDSVAYAISTKQITGQEIFKNFQAVAGTAAKFGIDPNDTVKSIAWLAGGGLGGRAGTALRYGYEGIGRMAAAYGVSEIDETGNRKSFGELVRQVGAKWTDDPNKLTTMEVAGGVNVRSGAAFGLMFAQYNEFADYMQGGGAGTLDDLSSKFVKQNPAEVAGAAWDAVKDIAYNFGGKRFMKGLTFWGDKLVPKGKEAKQKFLENFQIDHNNNIMEKTMLGAGVGESRYPGYNDAMKIYQDMSENEAAAFAGEYGSDWSDSGMKLKIAELLKYELKNRVNQNTRSRMAKAGGDQFTAFSNAGDQFLSGYQGYKTTGDLYSGMGSDMFAGGQLLSEYGNQLGAGISGKALTAMAANDNLGSKLTAASIISRMESNRLLDPLQYQEALIMSKHAPDFETRAKGQAFINLADKTRAELQPVIGEAKGVLKETLNSESFVKNLQGMSNSITLLIGSIDKAKKALDGLGEKDFNFNKWLGKAAQYIAQKGMSAFSNNIGITPAE